jgi:hypothetical protein
VASDLHTNYLFYIGGNMFNKLFTITALSIVLCTSFAYGQAGGIQDTIAADCEKIANDKNETKAHNSVQARENVAATRDVQSELEASGEGVEAGAHKDGTKEATE